jgi:hypothetical protein
VIEIWYGKHKLWSNEDDSWWASASESSYESFINFHGPVKRAQDLHKSWLDINMRTSQTSKTSIQTSWKFEPAQSWWKLVRVHGGWWELVVKCERDLQLSLIPIISRPLFTGIDTLRLAIFNIFNQVEKHGVGKTYFIIWYRLMLQKQQLTIPWLSFNNPDLGFFRYTFDMFCSLFVCFTLYFFLRYYSLMIITKR